MSDLEGKITNAIAFLSLRSLQLSPLDPAQRDLYFALCILRYVQNESPDLQNSPNLQNYLGGLFGEYPEAWRKKQ